MPTIEVPPVFVMWLGLLILPLLPQKMRPAAFLAFPLSALFLVLTIPVGTVRTMPFAHYELVVLQVTLLNRVFGIIFALIALLGGIYSLHLRETGQQSAALLYAGGAFGVTFCGDFFTLLVCWEVMAAGSTYLIWASRSKEAQDAGMQRLAGQRFARRLFEQHELRATAEADAVGRGRAHVEELRATRRDEGIVAAAEARDGTLAVLAPHFAQGLYPVRIARDARGHVVIAPGAGTNTTDAFAPASRTASRAVFQTGSPQASVPPRPGVTPPSTFVPNSSDRFVCSWPVLPMPCTISFVFASTRMLMRSSHVQQRRPSVRPRQASRQSSCLHPTGSHAPLRRWCPRAARPSARQSAPPAVPAICLLRPHRRE